MSDPGNYMQWLAVALGGAIGSVARFAAITYLAPLFNFRFPMSTFAVNILGSFLIGVAYVLMMEKTALFPEWRLFFMTGILGGFTTFSAFSLELLNLWQAGYVFNAIVYATSSVVLGVVMAYVGMALTQRLC